MTKKEYILEKAESLFAEKGFDATSVRDIARGAGINIAMISYYFGSKEKLMEELFKMRMSVGIAAVKDIAEDTSLPVVEKIERALSGYVNRVRSLQNFYKVILAEQATNKNRNVMRFLNKSRETYAAFFENLLQQGYNEGDFKTKMDPVFFMTTITGTIMHSLLNMQLYATYNKVKITESWMQEVYFEKVKAHLKTITRNILGYEQTN